MWAVFSVRGFFVIESFIVLNSIPCFSFIVASQYEQVFQSLSDEEGYPDKLRTFLDIFIVKGYKGTGLSQGLNSCRTSKRGIADKPQCPSNSFRLQILIAFSIESGKPYAYFIRRACIFLLEQSLFNFLFS